MIFIQVDTILYYTPNPLQIEISQCCEPTSRHRIITRLGVPSRVSQPILKPRRLRRPWTWRAWQPDHQGYYPATLRGILQVPNTCHLQLGYSLGTYSQISTESCEVKGVQAPTFNGNRGPNPFLHTSATMSHRDTASSGHSSICSSCSNVVGKLPQLTHFGLVTRHLWTNPNGAVVFVFFLASCCILELKSLICVLFAAFWS
jgi:hypothetical protein